jgi:hypothetical protein
MEIVMVRTGGPDHHHFLFALRNRVEVMTGFRLRTSVTTGVPLLDGVVAVTVVATEDVTSRRRENGRRAEREQRDS